MIHFVKFLHLVFILSLFGYVLYCVAMTWVSKTLPRHSAKIMLILVVAAALTGTLLVYPAHFTFHTPWIQAAYILMIVFSLGILVLQQKYRLPRSVRLVMHLCLVGILISVVHDAVTKTTFIF